MSSIETQSPAISETLQASAFLPSLGSSLRWMGSQEAYTKAMWQLVGIPYDGTCSNRPGTRFASKAIREASWGLETYSPLQDKDLDTDTSFYDAGELDLPLGNREGCLTTIRQATKTVLDSGKKWFGVGGEHLVTFPTMQAYVEKYPDIGVLHFDAHADLRMAYLGESLSHATVIRRVSELVTPERLVQIGIRSGPRDEFRWMKEHGTLLSSMEALPRGLERLKGRPVFLTIDLDVLDPSIFPGTGTPEPGGLTFNELMQWLLAFQSLNFVGVDVVELSPHYDASGVSTIAAAKVIREVLLMLKNQ